MNYQPGYQEMSKEEFEYWEEKAMEQVQRNYEAECARLQNVINMKEQEHQEKVARMANDLMQYEREIQILKAKLSVVELIFG